MHLLNVSRGFDLPSGWTKAILRSGNPEKNAQETAVNKKVCVSLNYILLLLLLVYYPVVQERGTI